MKLNFISKGNFKDITEFIFIKQIGIGSFGKVQLAMHIDTNKFYAIKIVKLDDEDLDQKELMLLQREIYLHSEVDHPHIIKLWDTIGDSNHVYLIMELAQNSSLFAYQNKKRILPQLQAFKYFNQTLKAIQYLHSINIMHRDIKPENILLDKNYNVKICDLGWATQNINQKRKTFCGTYQYMAPQMVFEKQYTYKIDTWALGVLLYELLHGYAPFRARSLQEIKQKISQGYYQIDPKFSKQLKILIVDLLQFNPDLRPQLSQIKNYAWVEKMKKQIKKEGMKIKAQILGISQQNNGHRSEINRKQAVCQSLPKKHKRVQSMQPNMNSKVGTQFFQFKNHTNITKKNLQPQQVESIKRIKKKCKTQGQESLQKYQTQPLKPHPIKLLQTTTTSLKKRSQKQNNNSTKNFGKWNNFHEYNSLQTNHKYEPVGLSKIKKISQKINEISLKMQKNDKKKTRLKTHNFF